MGKISDPHFTLIEYFKFIRHLNMENYAIGLNFRIKKINNSLPNLYLFLPI